MRVFSCISELHFKVRSYIDFLNIKNRISRLKVIFFFFIIFIWQDNVIIWLHVYIKKTFSLLKYSVREIWIFNFYNKIYTHTNPPIESSIFLFFFFFVNHFAWCKKKTIIIVFFSLCWLNIIRYVHWNVYLLDIRVRNISHVITTLIWQFSFLLVLFFFIGIR